MAVSNWRRARSQFTLQKFHSHLLVFVWNTFQTFYLCTTVLDRLYVTPELIIICPWIRSNKPCSVIRKSLMIHIAIIVYEKICHLALSSGEHFPYEPLGHVITIIIIIIIWALLTGELACMRSTRHCQCKKSVHRVFICGNEPARL